MKITRQMLVEKNACASGLDFFDERFPSGETPEFDWTPKTQKIVLLFACKWFGWLTQGTNLLPVFSMRGANLSGADLQRADLHRADLRWANLQGADLRWADLRWANLQGADLRGADLRGADLSGANLSGADLSWTYLGGADLSWTYLDGADLSGAAHNDKTQWPPGFDMDRLK